MIDEEGGISEVIQGDVTSEESCKSVVEQTVKLFGAVHILVNIGTYEMCSTEIGVLSHPPTYIAELAG